MSNTKSNTKSTKDQKDQKDQIVSMDAFNALSAKVDELQMYIENLPAPRDRGPKSDHKMDEKEAMSILHGEHKDLSHKKAALELGLSYGQIYSARNGFTFKSEFKGSDWETKLIAREKAKV